MSNKLPHQTDYVLLFVGIVLVVLPLLFVVAFPDRVDSAILFLRIVASLGGALVGSAIPGLLEINIPGVRAAGALAILVLFFQFNPPKALKNALIPPPISSKTFPLYSSSTEIKKENIGKWTICRSGKPDANSANFQCKIELQTDGTWLHTNSVYDTKTYATCFALCE